VEVAHDCEEEGGRGGQGVSTAQEVTNATARKYVCVRVNPGRAGHSPPSMTLEAKASRSL